MFDYLIYLFKSLFYRKSKKLKTASGIIYTPMDNKRYLDITYRIKHRKQLTYDEIKSIMLSSDEQLMTIIHLLNTFDLNKKNLINYNESI
jgi:hypothetical protein